MEGCRSAVKRGAGGKRKGREGRNAVITMVNESRKVV